MNLDRNTSNRSIQLALAALTAAIDGRDGLAEKLTAQLMAEDAETGTACAILTWAHMMVEHGADGQPTGRVKMATMNVDTGAWNDDDVSPEVRWVRRFVEAVSLGDVNASMAVALELNGIADGIERGGYVLQLLETAALCIRTFPRGYSRMGRT